jgi:hypothetical protein
LTTILPRSLSSLHEGVSNPIPVDIAQAGTSGAGV